MADSDGEYVEGLSDDELSRGAAPTAGGGVGGSTYGTRSKSARNARGDGAARRTKDKGRGRAAWEDIQRSWEDVLETDDGSIRAHELVEADKRRRLLRDTTPLQRGIIRHLVLVLDMSSAMADKDMPPSRFHVALAYAVDFVREYFEQNPISQMGVMGMHDGAVVRISDMSGDPADHVDRLREWKEQHEPQGIPSLQTALEICRGALL